jgi:hypothetical protein
MSDVRFLCLNKEMRDVFRLRAKNDFVSLLGAFLASVQEEFSACKATRRWCDELEGCDHTALLQSAYDALQAPVPRGHTKYDRAVLSITGVALNVYQLLEYRDVASVVALHSPLECLALTEKLPRMEEEPRRLLWKYVHELCACCYRYFDATLPVVPSVSEISADIARRRNAPPYPVEEVVGRRRPLPLPATAPSPHHAATNVSLDDFWSELCTYRSVTDVPFDAAVERRVRNGIAACTTSEAVVTLLPELGDDPYDMHAMGIVGRFSDMVVMTNAIPPAVMAGIERAASSLMNGDGDVGELDVEAIGRQVLQGVSDADVGSFAQNLDQIVPALTKSLRHMSPG